ncbi:adenine nucleotide alpha-hydrolase family protein [Azospirillum canadense]|uniref:hypothetical protein n=1 Tax=Azospirillum canadense TaxID=403962 RepID=UPI0022278AEA|nr:hypothetical protein [Azospirillum canadense]MCW2241442.1 uncharacterized protein [Azospirillum canadense]
MNADAIEQRLLGALDRHAAIAVAVSGGVDSMTLAAIAHRRRPGAVTMIHAVSPAVPKAATDRVRSRAERDGWALTVTGAGEFEDARYRANPVDRCYFCKANLYDRIRGLTPADGVIASGANLDDLDDYRPGLRAAAERNVVHPFVEAGITKAEVRALARRHGLDDVAELPAQPCLSSRVETGIAISADDLAFVERAEAALASLLSPGSTLRCRVTQAGIVVELDDPDHPVAAAMTASLCADAGRAFAGLRRYRRGAAFLGR